jgi:uncharacterized protein YkwD
MLFLGISRRSFRILCAALAISAIVLLAGFPTQAATQWKITDQIAKAKAQLFGEYPKVETAWPENIRPVVSVSVTPARPSASASRIEATRPAEMVPVAPNGTAAPTAPAQHETATAELKPAKTVPAEAPARKETAQSAEPTAKATEATADSPKSDATVQAAAVQAPAQAATETPAAAAATGDPFIDEILRLVNAARTAEGLAALTLSDPVNQAASIRVAELPASPSPHLRPDGDPFYSVFAEVGLKPKAGGENYAIGTAGAYSPEQIVEAWMNSSGHRKNIMNAAYRQIGIGHAVAGDKEYFEQLFIG